MCEGSSSLVNGDSLCCVCSENGRSEGELTLTSNAAAPEERCRAPACSNDRETDERQGGRLMKWVFGAVGLAAAGSMLLKLVIQNYNKALLRTEY